ncbi:MAG: phosphoglycerate mutase family protein [Phycisphaerae bacterium]|nr:phosphoglycerate mutase family protein [Phycisphaerae bacterium]MDW8262625.1 histidine phosphatase family protein [Phycisphaerales bacterium]
MRLVLIKHARPIVNPSDPPELWPLSEQGRTDATRLAEALAGSGIGRIFHSRETKASETARILADRLRVPVAPRDRLHEHDRSNVPHMRSADFISYIELFFRKPGELVLGKETADQCLKRFSDAVDSILAESGEDTPGVVTHGTVLALYLSRLGAGKPFDIWRRMQLPSFAVVDPAAGKVLSLIDRIG